MAGQAMSNSANGSTATEPPDAAGLHSVSVGWFVAVLAAIMSLALLFFVYRHGDNVPYFDDWLIVPVVTKHEPVTLSWLWSQKNEHRMPIQKLLLLGLYRISACDFRSGMYYSAAVLI